MSRWKLSLANTESAGGAAAGHLWSGYVQHGLSGSVALPAGSVLLSRNAGLTSFDRMFSTSLASDSFTLSRSAAKSLAVGLSALSAVSPLSLSDLLHATAD